MIVMTNRYGRWELPAEKRWPYDTIALRFCFPESFRENVKTVRLVGIRLGSPWRDVLDSHVIPMMKELQLESALDLVDLKIEEAAEKLEAANMVPCSLCGGMFSARKRDKKRQCAKCKMKKKQQPEVCSVCQSSVGVRDDSPCTLHFGHNYLCADCYPKHRQRYENCSSQHRDIKKL
jgi:hypothetical protein